MIDPLAPGAVVKDQYQVAERIGHGGFGVVYRGFQQPIGREVAIKVLYHDHQGKAAQRFLREAQTAALLDHPNIVRLHDYGLIDGQMPFMILEYLEGHDLAQELKLLGAMEHRRALSLFADCLDALAEAHDEGIVHRDLKPSNLFLSHPRKRRERIKVLDFGIAYVAHLERLTEGDQEPLGTPRYAAPESLTQRHQPPTPAADVYALGLILVEMLSGKPAINAPTWPACLIAHTAGDLNIPEAILSGPIGPVVRRSTALDPRARYPDARAFLDAIEALLADDGPDKIARAEARLGALERDLLSARLDASEAHRACATLNEQRRDLQAALDASKARHLQTQAALDALLTSPPAPDLPPALARSSSSALSHLLTPPASAAAIAAHAHGASPRDATPAPLTPWTPSGASMAALPTHTTPSEPAMASLASSTPSSWGSAPPSGALKALPPTPAVSSPELSIPGPAATISAPALAGVIRVEAGSFLMGSPEDEPGRQAAERQHSVQLTRALLVQSTPVTQQEWVACMGHNPATFPGEGDLPVESINWFSAIAFCNAMSRREGLEESYLLSDLHGAPGQREFKAAVAWRGPDCPGWRLLTEAEWEYVARAGSSAFAPAPLDKFAWFKDNSGQRPHPVGQKAPNAWGLHDTLGNVWEWVWDAYAPYARQPAVDPAGPEAGTGRVWRGGSFRDDARLLRVAGRAEYGPSYASNKVGLRVCRSLIGGAR